MDLRGAETQNCGPNKDAKSKTKSEPLCSKDDIQATSDLLNPSVLDEVLAEKKLALMRSPEVMKFLQSQQAKLAKEGKEED